MTSKSVVPTLDLVPADVLERPPRDLIRRVDKDDAALIVDEQLRGLARHEAACRRVLGTVAAAFLRTEAHHALSFARLSDYTRERLGLSVREVQVAAQVARALATLPAIDAAFERGEVSWTQVRLLTATATAATEAEWLRRARGRTVRALDAMVRSARDVGASDAEATSSISVAARIDATLAECAEEQSEDGEPVVVIRVSCPARVRSVWRDTVELARRVAGEALPVWQAAEAIAAEALSGAPTASRARTTAVATSVEITPSDGWNTGSSAPTWSTSMDVGEEGGVVQGPTADSDETRDVFARASGFDDLDWRAVAATLPADVDGLARDLDGLEPAALDRRLRLAVRALQRLDWQAGRLLRLCFDLRLYRILGFSSAARYVRERLGLSTGKAAALVAVERRLWDVPALGEGYREGRISWLQALTLLPVVSERHAPAWIARAGEVTLRRLAAEVRWALDEQDSHRSFAWIAPPPPNATLERPPLQMRAHWVPEQCNGAITFRGPASVAALFTAAVEAFRPPGQPAWVGVLALLDHVRAEWEAQPCHRDPIFSRDGWQCTVPACSARRNLHDHHIRFRSRGGGNERSNRTTVCAWHHLRGIHHRGRVLAWGRAPHAIQWALGVGTDGVPLLRCVGDRYVRGGELELQGADRAYAA